MGINTPSLEDLKKQHWEDFSTRLNPVRRAPEWDILKINSLVNAGMIQMIHANLSFLSLQLFPSTAEGDFLDAHWAWRTFSRKTETFSVGNIEVNGVAGTPIPAGHGWSLDEVTYVAQEPSVVGEDGTVRVKVRSLTAGSGCDSQDGDELEALTPLAGIENTATSKGIGGGADKESDSDYRIRMLANLRRSTRYGREGDWASWALDSSAEVVKAWEFPLSDAWGTLLIQVLGDDAAPVVNLERVKTYIRELAPPALWDVKTPDLRTFDVSITFDKLAEDTLVNRKAIEKELFLWMDQNARPQMTILPGALSGAVLSLRDVTSARVSLGADKLVFSVYEYPRIGAIRWN